MSNFTQTYDSRYLMNDLASGAETFYVATTGNDTTGDGTIANPWLTPYRAVRDIPPRSFYKRTINFAAGTYTLNKDLNLDFRSTDTGDWITFQGVTTSSSAYTINAIVSDTQQDGLVFSVVGAAWAANEHRGKLVKFTSGGLNDRYGRIYQNSATELYVTKDYVNNETFLTRSPAGGNTFVIVTLGTIFNGTSNVVGLHMARYLFQDIAITGNFKFSTQLSTVQFERCDLLQQQLAAGNDGRILVSRSYVLSGSGSPSTLITTNPGSHITFLNGSVLDCYKAAGNLLCGFTAGTNVEFTGETVFLNTASSGLQLNGGIGWATFNTATVRFGQGCAGGFQDNLTNYIAPSRLRLPFVCGTLTGNYRIIAGPQSSYKIDGGIVTTALGTNNDSIDGGTTEGYLSESTGAMILDVSRGFENLKLTSAAGVITLVDRDGNAISSTNRVKIWLPNKTDTSSDEVYLSSAFTFNDAAHATSHFLNVAKNDGMEFGVTANTAWGNARPIAVGFLWDGTTAYPAWSMNPVQRDAGAGTNLGYKQVKAATASDNNIVAWTTTDITASHANGSFTPVFGVTGTMANTEDWTITLGSFGNAMYSGLLKIFSNFLYTMPTLQMGANVGHCLNNGGTAPTFTTNTYLYSLGLDGYCFVQMFLDSDGGADGAGANNAQIALPYLCTHGCVQTCSGSAFVMEPTTAYICAVITSAATNFMLVRSNIAAANLQNTTSNIQWQEFGNGNRSIQTSFRYKAF